MSAQRPRWWCTCGVRVGCVRGTVHPVCVGDITRPGRARGQDWLVGVLRMAATQSSLTEAHAPLYPCPHTDLMCVPWWAMFPVQPTQDEFIHHHHDDQQQQQQQGQYNPHNQQWERQGHHREALSTAPGDDHGGQGHDNAAPVSHHAPHDHHFPDAGHWDHRYDNWDHSEHHDLHQWSHYEESIDPLDQVGDGLV